jgi:hypothetical protein
LLIKQKYLSTIRDIDITSYHYLSSNVIHDTEQIFIKDKKFNSINSLDIFTVLSYIGLNIDIIFQIRRVYKTKSSRDLSLFGC